MAGPALKRAQISTDIVTDLGRVTDIRDKQNPTLEDLRTGSEILGRMINRAWAEPDYLQKLKTMNGTFLNSVTKLQNLKASFDTKLTQLTNPNASVVETVVRQDPTVTLVLGDYKELSSLVTAYKDESYSSIRQLNENLGEVIGRIENRMASTPGYKTEFEKIEGIGNRIREAVASNDAGLAGKYILERANAIRSKTYGELEETTNVVPRKIVEDEGLGDKIRKALDFKFIPIPTDKQRKRDREKRFGDN